MKIAWLRQASLSLDQEYDYLARKNPLAAKHVFRRIVAATRRLVHSLIPGGQGRFQAHANWSSPAFPFSWFTV